MRIISFSEFWLKLTNSHFTTFRFPRKDKDWGEGEVVQVFYKNRSPNRKKLGEAIIVSVEPKKYGADTDEEAQADGFKDLRDMEHWMIKKYGEARTYEPMNKLTLQWVYPTN